MRKLQFITIIATIALAIPFVALALIEAVYLIDYERSIGGAAIGVIEWRSVALEGSACWPELAGMIIGQLLILSTLLFLCRRKSDSDPPRPFWKRSFPLIFRTRPQRSVRPTPTLVSPATALVLVVCRFVPNHCAKPYAQDDGVSGAMKRAPLASRAVLPSARPHPHFDPMGYRASSA